MPRALFVLAVATCAFGQQPLTPSLIEFLDLTATQITRLRQNAAEFNKFHAEKQQRYAQVSAELQEEFARDVLDPLALGQRQVEQEAICRELRTAYEQNFTKNQSVLSDAQKAKLKTLDTIQASAMLARSAQNVNLLDAPLSSAIPLASIGGVGTVRIFDPYTSTPTVFGGCAVPTVQANPVLSTNAKEAKQ